MTQRNNFQTAALPYRANAFAAASSGQSALVNSLETTSARVAAPPCRTRRAVRIAVALPVSMRDQFGAQEETHTQFVMLRGAVIATTSNVRVGHKVSIRNIRNGKTAECHVIGVESMVKGVHQVEVEFTGPQPVFWPVQFPAEDSSNSDTTQAGDTHESKSAVPGGSVTAKAFVKDSRPVEDFRTDPLLELHRLDALSAFSDAGASKAADSHDEIVVLAGPLTEQFTSSRNITDRVPSKRPAVDSVAQFRAANRAAHRREKSMKVVYSVLSLAALALLVATSKTWMPTSASATPFAHATTAPEKPAAIARDVEIQPSTTSAQPSANEAENTSKAVSSELPVAAASAELPSSGTDAKPAEIPKQMETTIEVRHGASAASFRNPTVETEEEPIALPLKVSEGPGSQSKPEILSAVAQTPVKAALLAPQAPKRAIPAKLLRSIPAQYPAVARQMRLRGDVVVSLQIDPSGTVTAARVISGSPLLSAAALDSVRRWKYQPATLGEKAVASTQEVKLSFNLK